MSRVSKLFQGWNLVIVTFIAVAGMFAAIFIAMGGSGDAVRLIIRNTARSSAILFGLAFSASALAKLWPNTFTRWQIKNRRYIGLSFATSHFIHAVGIATWAVLYPDAFRAYINPVTVIGGGLGYVFVIAMAATSFDSAVRWLGARRWSLLHTVGGYYIWIVFAQNFVIHALKDPFYIPFAVFIVGVLALRIAARFKRPGLAAA